MKNAYKCMFLLFRSTVFFACMASLIPGKIFAGTITFNTALPVAQGEGILRVQSKVIRSTDVALLPDGSLIVADAYNDRIQVFGGDGELIRKWGGPCAINIYGNARGWFNVATAVTVGPQGNIFVADFYNHCVQKFTPEGRFLAAIGSEGSDPGWLKYPTDVALDDKGNLYVVDFGNNRVQKFSP